MSVTAMKVLTDRINRIEVSATMAITAEALKMQAAGIDLANFGAGEPHFATPQHIKDAAIDAIEKNFSKYTNVAGVPAVRKAVVERHAADFGTNYTVGRVRIYDRRQAGDLQRRRGAGGARRRGNCAGAVLGVVQGHHRVCRRQVRCLCESVEAENFRVTAKMIEAAITPKTKAIILNTPSNPSGAVIPAEDLYAIVRLAHKLGIYVLLDECYVYLDFSGAAVSGASCTECKEHVLVLGSLSKTYAMTGWRAGFALGPKPIISAMSKLQSQWTSNTTTRGAEGVDRGADRVAGRAWRRCATDYMKLRDRILAGFKTIPGLTCTVPQGAFYVYPNVSAFIGKGGIKSASDLAQKLLTEAHVVVVPGEAFGTDEHMRLSYAVSGDVVDKGVERMREYFAKLG